MLEIGAEQGGEERIIKSLHVSPTVLGYIYLELPEKSFQSQEKQIHLGAVR